MSLLSHICFVFASPTLGKIQKKKETSSDNLLLTEFKAVAKYTLFNVILSTTLGGNELK